jgi:CBS domain-containing protein
MQLQGKALRVIIYIGESDHVQGKPLYMALLQLLKREGASGGTVIRGLAGFGAKSRIHTATILTLSEDLPLRLEWVESPETVDRVLPQIRRLVNDGLITVEEVDVVQYAPGRRTDALAQPVQDVMRREVVTIAPDAPATEVLSLLLQKGYRSLPVVDRNDRLLGILTDGDLLRRGGLLARLDLQAELSRADWQRQLEEMRRRPDTAADLMTTPVISLPANASLQQAMTAMVENNLKRLPVLDADGRLAGWISRVDILRTIEYHHSLPPDTAEPAPAGANIAELMIEDVPKVPAGAPLEALLEALEHNRRRLAVVVGEDGRVLGILTDGDLLRRAQRRVHPGLIARLRALVTGEFATDPVSLPEGSETAGKLLTTPVVTLPFDASPAEALRLMMKHGVKRLPVLDADGRLIGLLGRASLLRSFHLNPSGPANK